MRAYAQEAARLRELAASVMTPRVRSPDDEADNQERLAQAAKRGIVRPQPMRVRQSSTDSDAAARAAG